MALVEFLPLAWLVGFRLAFRASGFLFLLRGTWIIKKLVNPLTKLLTLSRLGDFVYRSTNTSHAVAGGKLGPKWEGPYEVTEALGDGAYKLRSMDETLLPRT
nr:reverse transcriptase domain-containing protein [Tanacetum cinerariifolium]